jgi:hypothetical protein
LKAEAMALQHESSHAAHAPVVVPPQPEYAPESVAIDDGWIDHDGNGCPVDAETLVEVLFRDGSKNSGIWMARRYSWNHVGKNGDIVKWKPA